MTRASIVNKNARGVSVRMCINCKIVHLIDIVCVHVQVQCQAALAAQAVVETLVAEAEVSRWQHFITPCELVFRAPSFFVY